MPEALNVTDKDDDELLELQSCIKLESMSQTGFSYSTSSSLDIRSSSGRHEDLEDAVEIVKAGLKELQPGAFQVCKLSICPGGRQSYTSAGVPWNWDGGIQRTVRFVGGGQS